MSGSHSTSAPRSSNSSATADPVTRRTSSGKHQPHSSVLPLRSAISDDLAGQNGWAQGMRCVLPRGCVTDDGLEGQNDLVGGWPVIEFAS